MVESACAMHETQMYKEIEIELLLIYSRIGINKPDNHNNIMDFIIDDVMATADPVNWGDADVAIAFRRFIESKTADYE